MNSYPNQVRLWFPWRTSSTGINEQILLHSLSLHKMYPLSNRSQSAEACFERSLRIHTLRLPHTIFIHIAHHSFHASGSLEMLLFPFPLLPLCFIVGTFLYRLSRYIGASCTLSTERTLQYKRIHKIFEAEKKAERCLRRCHKVQKERAELQKLNHSRKLREEELRRLNALNYIMNGLIMEYKEYRREVISLKWTGIPDMERPESTEKEPSARRHPET
ncbi:hypothetical protein VTO42DRAFT_8035 [Malbranchea cinnamomea]